MMNVNIESKDELAAKTKYSGTSRPTHVTKGSTYRPFQFASVKKTVQLRNKSCILHPTVASHSLMECHKFLALEESKRWEVAREHQLCFNCLKSDHHSRNCKEKAKCTQCHLFHHMLLHRSDHKSRSNTSSHGLKKEEEGSFDKHDAKPVTLGVVVNVDNQAIAQIGLMILTAPCRDAKGCVLDCVKFFAAVDTGATHTICSRELAETLHGVWLPEDEKEYKLFNGKPIKYNVMVREMELMEHDKTFTSLGKVSFVDQKLPFYQYLPPDVNVPKRIDMIVGSEFAWEYFLILFLERGRLLPTRRYP